MLAWWSYIYTLMGGRRSPGQPQYDLYSSGSNSEPNKSLKFKKPGKPARRSNSAASSRSRASTTSGRAPSLTSMLKRANSSERISAARTGNVPRNKFSSTVTQSMLDGWYNEFYSANSECADLPYPHPPTIRGVPDKIMCVSAAYRNAITIAPGAAGFLLFNRHAGPACSAFSGTPAAWVPILSSDFLWVPYANMASKLSNAGGLTAASWQNANWDAVGWAASMPIPPVNGVDPRDLVQPNMRTGGYCLLGATMNVQVTTTLNGLATLYAADDNQNPRNWGQYGITSNVYHPGVTIPGSVIADGEHIMPGNCPGTMRYPMPPSIMPVSVPGAPVGSEFLPGTPYDPTLNDFFGSYTKTVIGGNAHAYAWAQIAGDSDFTPGCGIIQSMPNDGFDLMAVSGEYPIGSLLPLLFASGCAICVANSGTDSLAINIECTASFACPAEPTIPDYFQARPCGAHIVRDMTYLDTAVVSTKSHAAARQEAKTLMMSKMEASETGESRIARAIMNPTSIVSARVISTPRVGSQMSPDQNRALLPMLWDKLKTAARQQIETHGPALAKAAVSGLVGLL